MSETPPTAGQPAAPVPGLIGDQPAAAFGFWLSLGTLALGIILGNVAAGAQTTLDGYGGETLTSFTTGTNGDGGFNWLIFSIFAATALLCMTIGFCVACITRNMPIAEPPTATSTDPGYAA